MNNSAQNMITIEIARLKEFQTTRALAIDEIKRLEILVRMRKDIITTPSSDFSEGIDEELFKDDEIQECLDMILKNEAKKSNKEKKGS